MNEKTRHLIDNYPEKGKIEQEILSICRDILDDNSLDMEKDFFEWGVDSVFLIQILNKINEKFKMNLSIVDFFQNPSVKKISEYIIENMIYQELSSDSTEDKEE